MTSRHTFGQSALRGAALLAGLLLFAVTAGAEDKSGEQLYRQLSRIAGSEDGVVLFEALNRQARELDWEGADEDELEFVGNLRIIRTGKARTPAGEGVLYLVRRITGEIFVLSLPEDHARLAADAPSPYAGLSDKYENKMVFRIQALSSDFHDHTYRFARLTAAPQQLFMDRIFKIFVILMLFFVMIGMGMTLTFKDFALVFTKPRGILLGEVLQFGVMPLFAFGLGYLMGFHENYPFIFVGLILITAIPGGVTSNIMTYYAKGDLALSISLTSFSTVLSIIFTPLLLALYCSNMPEVTVPVAVVMQTILVLVIIPLAIGMSVRGRWPGLAQKCVPILSALGIVALLVLICAGILGNLEAFADTARHGVKFYSTLFILTFLGMMLGIVFSKLIGINNYQTRAISLETGLRNAALAMTIALLIQDAMGDFYSSMFITSGMFGLVMYLAGLISIFLYKPLLPVAEDEPSSTAQPQPEP
jgi:bile acid transporter